MLLSSDHRFAVYWKFELFQHRIDEQIHINIRKEEGKTDMHALNDRTDRIRYLICYTRKNRGGE